ncbi:aspartyl protease family protein, partial [Burkholderia sp. SIMBA_024]|uniref:aspartyl protease family protein n=1 Tax=Burkholderia sp. SIMBA_024 TaxID=3085768 RepID=UPI00397DEB57
MPGSRPVDSVVTSGSGSTTVPMRLLNNHVFVDVRVNGRGPFPFLLDTGGHDILTPQTARALGLDVIGQATT